MDRILLSLPTCMQPVWPTVVCALLNVRTPHLLKRILSPMYHQGDRCFLRREEAMIDGTRSALQHHSAALRGDRPSAETSSSLHPVTTGDEVSLSAEQVAERLQISPAPQEFESKTESKTETPQNPRCQLKHRHPPQVLKCHSQMLRKICL